MQFKEKEISEILQHFMRLSLLEENEFYEVLKLFEIDFLFNNLVSIADSIHLHIKVADVDKLPQPAILKLNTQPTQQKSGYVKYPFDCGINMIFSSISVAKEDLAPNAPRVLEPHLDHTGIDIRQDNKINQQLFDTIPQLATQHYWRAVTQGGIGKSVYCCHVEVAQKHWVFPPSCSAFKRPLEFAYGPLKINQTSMGCDLRPADPAMNVRDIPTCNNGNNYA